MDNITMLPEVLLIEIFGYLSPNMVKTCSLVCKRWNDVIGNSVEIMQQFKLNFKNIREIHVDEAKRQKRKYSNVIVGSQLDRSISSFQNLRAFSIKACEIDLKVLIDTLNSLKLLEIFNACCVNFTDEAIDLENNEKAHVGIKEMRIRDCDKIMLDIFDIDTLRSFFVHMGEECPKTILKLLKKQKNLQELCIGRHTFNGFLNSAEILELDLHLKRFEIERYRSDVSDDPIGIAEFLQRQNSLEALKIDVVNINEFKFIVEKLPYLKSLEIERLIKEDSGDLMLQQVKCNDQIEALIFGGWYDRHKREIIQKFTNLKYVNLGKFFSFRDETLTLLNTTANGLVSLEIPITSSTVKSNYENVYFPKLKEFSFRLSDLDCEDDYVDFKPFISRHSSTLEKISIDNDEDRRATTIFDEIFNCPKLKHLTVSKFTVELKEILDKYSVKNKMFTLKIIINDPSSLIYKFPDDVALFNEHFKYLIMYCLERYMPSKTHVKFISDMIHE